MVFYDPLVAVPAYPFITTSVIYEYYFRVIIHKSCHWPSYDLLRYNEHDPIHDYRTILS